MSETQKSNGTTPPVLVTTCQEILIKCDWTAGVTVAFGGSVVCQHSAIKSLNLMMLEALLDLDGLRGAVLLRAVFDLEAEVSASQG